MAAAALSQAWSQVGVRFTEITHDSCVLQGRATSTDPEKNWQPYRPEVTKISFLHTYVGQNMSHRVFRGILVDFYWNTTVLLFFLTRKLICRPSNFRLSRPLYLYPLAVDCETLTIYPWNHASILLSCSDLVTSTLRSRQVYFRCRPHALDVAVCIVSLRDLENMAFTFGMKLLSKSTAEI